MKKRSKMSVGRGARFILLLMTGSDWYELTDFVTVVF
jgi:hypothetical protein